MKMNPEVKKLWLEALRSGEYKQGKGWLQKDGGFCCLGVLCDVYAKKKGMEIGWDNNDGVNFFLGSKSYLPFEVEKWAGLSTAIGAVVTSEDGHTAGLDVHNDRGQTFEQIAKMIEEQL